MIVYSQLLQLVSHRAAFPERYVHRVARHLAAEGLFVEAPIGRPPVVAPAHSEAVIDKGHLVNLLLGLTTNKAPFAPTHVRAVRRMVPVNDSHSRQFLRGDTCGETLERFLADWHLGIYMPLDVEVHRIGSRLAVTMRGDIKAGEMCCYVPPSEGRDPPRPPEGAIPETRTLRTPLLDHIAYFWQSSLEQATPAQSLAA